MPKFSYAMSKFNFAKVEDLEFDSSGKVVRKEHFEKSMAKIVGILRGEINVAPRRPWTLSRVQSVIKENGLADIHK
ncbi:TPA: hypothetical protein OV554_003574 [Acinetobacter baumannii]|nr:hypothetical protein [Acinetobacter baumannii]